MNSAKMAGWSLLVFFTACLVGVLVFKVGFAWSLVFVAACFVALVLAYAIGLAVTGDWGCWRELIP